MGAGAPISVQSMTNTVTANVPATINQVRELEAAGADMVRISCPDEASTAAFAKIAAATKLPLIADIHFHYKRALEAAEAGASCLRINPGNIGSSARVSEVVKAAKDFGCSMRIGVNAGSLERDLLAKYGEPCPEAMVESALNHARILEDHNFHNFKISVKASDVFLTIDSYRSLAKVCDYPLHLGVTEAGGLMTGAVRTSLGLGALLREGIGDTIRYSLTADPVAEVRAGRQLLESMGLRERRNVDLIACPSCGRAEIDVVGVAEEAMAAFEDREIPLQVAVMGCVVNGPGEARDADLGIAAGRGRGHLFIRGQNAAVVPEDEMVEALVEWAEIIHEEGPEAALAKVDTEKAAREANRDREDLLIQQGEDTNDTNTRIDLIRRHTS